MVTKHRSPNYPSIDLGDAIDRVHQLYTNVQRGEFNGADAAKAWGYSSFSGPVKRGMGALRQYGLIDKKKGDNAKLSTRALTIALRNTASIEYQDALRDAALDPPLFEELYQNGKALAAQDALKQHLVVEKQFTDEGAARFISVLHASLTLAHVGDSGSIAGQDEVLPGESESMQVDTPNAPSMKQHPSAEPGTRSIQIPLPGAPWATLHALFPMSEETWNQMMTMLHAMKPGLVGSEPPQAAPNAGNDELGDDDSEYDED